jgi:hypothetical protein
MLRRPARSVSSRHGSDLGIMVCGPVRCASVCFFPSSCCAAENWSHDGHPIRRGWSSWTGSEGRHMSQCPAPETSARAAARATCSGARNGVKMQQNCRTRRFRHEDSLRPGLWFLLGAECGARTRSPPPVACRGLGRLQRDRWRSHAQLGGRLAAYVRSRGMGAWANIPVPSRRRMGSSRRLSVVE